MAIARCQQCGNPKSTKQQYPHPHSPLAEQDIMCGSPKCSHPALVWLSDAEEQRYQQSAARTFSVARYRGVELH